MFILLVEYGLMHRGDFINCETCYFCFDGSIDDCEKHFNTIFFEAACNCMPVKTVTIRSKDAAWINADIRWAIKQRYRLFKKANRSNKDEDWRDYRTYRNLVTIKIRDRKLEYLNELDLKASDPKQFGTKEWWKLVKQFMSKKGIYDDIPSIFFNGTLYSSIEDKANALNEYFYSTIDIIQSKRKYSKCRVH